MSKAKFPNTTRRRLSSSVVCRLSSSGAAFFFPRFFFPRPVTPLGQEASQARSLQLLFTADDRAEGPVAGGAARPVARTIDEDAGPVADDNAEGPVARGGDAARSLANGSAEEPVAGGRCEACGRCCPCRAPVTHIFTTACPVIVFIHSCPVAASSDLKRHPRR